MTVTMTATIGLGTILAAATLVWILSVRLRDASIADVCWGLGFVLLAWLYFALSPGSTPRAWLVATLITLWGVRLSVHIFRRNHGKGEDPRYRAMRALHGRAFWWRSLFTVFWLQAALLWFVALPLLVAVRASQPAAFTAFDGLGVLCFAVGLAFEVVGDHQLERFRAEALASLFAITVLTASGLRPFRRFPVCRSNGLLQERERCKHPQPIKFGQRFARRTERLRARGSKAVAAEVGRVAAAPLGPRLHGWATRRRTSPRPPLVPTSAWAAATPRRLPA